MEVGILDDTSSAAGRLACMLRIGVLPVQHGTKHDKGCHQPAELCLRALTLTAQLLAVCDWAGCLLRRTLQIYWSSIFACGSTEHRIRDVVVALGVT